MAILKWAIIMILITGLALLFFIKFIDHYGMGHVRASFGEPRRLSRRVGPGTQGTGSQGKQEKKDKVLEEVKKMLLKECRVMTLD